MFRLLISLSGGGGEGGDGPTEATQGQVPARALWPAFDLYHPRRAAANLFIFAGSRAGLPQVRRASQVRRI